MAISGNWTVTLDLQPPVSQLAEVLDYVTKGQFSIVSIARDRLPDYMLIHDRRDGVCWLWGFETGLRFVEATDPVVEGAIGSSFCRATTRTRSLPWRIWLNNSGSPLSGWESSTRVARWCTHAAALGVSSSSRISSRRSSNRSTTA
jgi:hypothetical protein